ncbi:MAG TPA: PKD domain-containing protein [Saprospiraceae bacterium]|nr:PKD domain-containing protein [Saprospiraceae bacterium]
MKQFRTLFLLILFQFLLFKSLTAQLANGATAPDFTVTTINGGSFSLYSAMGSSKAACLDFMATWCSPCWSFHQSHVLSNVYTNLGSQTTAIMLEGDYNTNTDCLYDLPTCTGSGTWGNWVTGTPYPIADLSSSDGVREMYQVSYFPTLYVISPDKRAWEIISRTYSNYENWITKSFKLNVTNANVTNSNCGNDGKIQLSVAFGYGALQYKWSNGATTKDLTNVGGGTYKVTITDANGYFDEFGPWTIDGPERPTEIVYEKITHNLCFSGTSGSISLSTDYGTPPYNYQWNSGQTTESIFDIPAGNYRVSVTDNNGCILIKSFLVTEPSQMFTDRNSLDEICDGQNGWASFLPRGGVPPYRYNIGKGYQSSNEFVGLKQGNYSVTITDRNNCNLIDEFTLGGTSKPEVKPGLGVNITCLSDTIILFGEGSSVGNEFRYQWTTKSGRIVGSSNQLEIKADKKGWYVLQIHNTQNGCSNLDSVYVNDIRKYPFISAPNDSTLNCKTQSLILEGKTQGPHMRYYWTILNTNYKDSSRVITVNQKDNYVFNVLDTINFCLSKDTVIIQKDVALPVIQLASKDELLLCKANEKTLDAAGSSFGQRYDILWTTSNGNILSGQNTLNPIINRAGQYLLNISDHVNYCSASASIEIVEFIELKPEFDVKKTNDFDFEFTNNTLGNIVTLLWNFGDSKTSTEINPKHSFTQIGEFKVCLEVENPCGLQSNCKTIKVSTPTSTEEELIEHFSVAPNPSYGKFEIRSNLITKNSTIQIFNTNGVLLNNVEIKTELNKAIIEIKNVKSGIYFAEIQTGKLKKIKKLIVVD